MSKAFFERMPRPAIFAHRGASAHAPENTLAAFDLALHQGADGIEPDVQLTRDEQVVVIHDQTVNRTTQGKGRVRDLTLAQIKLLDAGSHFDIAFLGEPIPTLDEVLATFGHRTLLNIELKNYATPLDKLPEKVIEQIRFYHLESRVLLSSFNPIALRKVKRLAPEIPVGLLVLSGARGTWARNLLGRWFVPYETLHLPLKDAKNMRLPHTTWPVQRIFVYVVNHSNDMNDMFALGVHGIFTDDPLLACRALTIYRHRQSGSFSPPWAEKTTSQTNE